MCSIKVNKKKWHTHDDEIIYKKLQSNVPADILNKEFNATEIWFGHILKKFLVF